ncbi:MAG: TRAP transporter substrate-binding protein DctP, partial [Polyangia bacterium]
MRALALSIVAIATAAAHAAEPRAIKLASITPEGTFWSRELRATAQEIEAGTNGAVHLKLYLGAVAGDEMEVAARIAKGQLDAVGSAGVMCDR